MRIEFRIYFQGVICLDIERIGIFGGTFDPIHNGHLILAEYARASFGLDKLIFIPTGKSPHKEDIYITPKLHRYNMVLLAINLNPNYFLSAIEILKDGIAYTVDTIKYLNTKFEGKEIYFILGSDSFLQIHKWKNYEELLGLCSFIVLKRHNSGGDKLDKRIKELTTLYNSRIYILESPLIDISSTDIRNRKRKGLPIRYLVPESVEAYVVKNDLYKE